MTYWLNYSFFITIYTCSCVALKESKDKELQPQLLSNIIFNDCTTCSEEQRDVLKYTRLDVVANIKIYQLLGTPRGNVTNGNFITLDR